MKILFISHTATGGPFVVGSHHLSRAMTRMGHEVVHLSPPVTLGHMALLRERFERVRILRWWRGGDCLQGVRDVVPGAPLPWAIVRRLAKEPHRLFGSLLKGSVSRQLNHPRPFRPELVFIDEPRLVGLLELIPAARTVYRATDLYARIRRDDSILLAERELIGRAHRFIATSQPVAEHLEALGAPEVLIMENGVDLDNFQPRGRAADPDRNASRIAIYVGAIDQRFCFKSITQAATENPDVTFWLLGPVTKEGAQQLGHLPNVKMHGAVDFAALGGYLSQASVALLPLSEDPSNAGRSPMKLFEYAAVGLPVIATATPELRRRDLRFVSLASTPTDFALRVKAWFSGQLHLEDGIEEAAKHSWAAKATQALEYALS